MELKNRKPIRRDCGPDEHFFSSTLEIIKKQKVPSRGLSVNKYDSRNRGLLPDADTVSSERRCGAYCHIAHQGEMYYIKKLLFFKV